ncbi:hypothetical protein FOL47_011039 [Perkinsus chesapeaki]|uniref:sn-1-specific diacylglycerol lipase n=1 Tax=Perkinsus chesapeaki TaxID=330153 RepID=A0A7J6KYU4_PERCH|nr:hypothetical protein FOL47_011039 [Perkinsus chesapeaki]
MLLFEVSSHLACATVALSRVYSRRVTYCEEQQQQQQVREEAEENSSSNTPSDRLKKIANDLETESLRLSDRAAELKQEAFDLAAQESDITSHKDKILHAAEEVGNRVSETVDQAVTVAESAKRAAEAARVAADSVTSAARAQWDEFGATARAAVANAKLKAAQAKERQREAQVNIDMVQSVWRRIGDYGKEDKGPQQVMYEFVNMCRSRPSNTPDWSPNKFGRKLVDINPSATLSTLALAEAAYECDAISKEPMSREEYDKLSDKSERSIFSICPDIDEVLFMSPEGGFEGTDPLKPRFFVARRNDGVVVLSIRGTATVADAITDMLCDDVEVYTGDESSKSNNLRVHRGIGAGAVWVAKTAMPYIREGLSRAGSRGRLLITGHSLGGGVALVTGLLMASQLSPRVWVQSIAFAPPPVLSDTLEGFRGLGSSTIVPWNLRLISYVNDGDIIARTCMHSLEYLVAGWRVNNNTSHTVQESVPLVIPGKVYIIGMDHLHPNKAILTNGMDPTFGETSLVDFFCEIARSNRPMVPKAGFAHLIESYKKALLGEYADE